MFDLLFNLVDVWYYLVWAYTCSAKAAGEAAILGDKCLVAAERPYHFDHYFYLRKEVLNQL